MLRKKLNHKVFTTKSIIMASGAPQWRFDYWHGLVCKDSRDRILVGARVFDHVSLNKAFQYHVR